MYVYLYREIIERRVGQSSSIVSPFKLEALIEKLNGVVKLSSIKGRKEVDEGCSANIYYF